MMKTCKYCSTYPTSSASRSRTTRELNVSSTLTPPRMLYFAFFLIFSSFCGVASVETEFTLDTGFETLEVCFEVDSGLPANVPVNEDLFYICINLVPAQLGFLEFSMCDIKIDDNSCNYCIVCEGNRDFTIDCSNININPIRGAGFIAGPKTTQCFGIGGLLGLLE